ncbi:hypothetical protein P9210_12350, partial [Heyndrickxia coagulans]|nr:hypothetical protein [Heyndrickxia coagulans]
ILNFHSQSAADLFALLIAVKQIKAKLSEQYPGSLAYTRKKIKNNVNFQITISIHALTEYSKI